MKFTEYLKYVDTNSSRRITESSSSKVQPKDLNELRNIVEWAIKEKGNDCDLNFIDTSRVNNMMYLFSSTNFNGDISKWDVSRVKSMKGMFLDSDFNGDISKWDVSNVTEMYRMFSKSKFNGDISKWDTSKVEDMSAMFKDSVFNRDISKWDVSNVKAHHVNMFTNCPLENNSEFQPKFDKELF